MKSTPSIPKFSISHEKRLRALAETDSNVSLLLGEIDRLRDVLSEHRKWLDRARKNAAQLDNYAPQLHKK
jgi:hypothetical protein